MGEGHTYCSQCCAWEVRSQEEITHTTSPPSLPVPSVSHRDLAIPSIHPSTCTEQDGAWAREDGSSRHRTTGSILLREDTIKMVCRKAGSPPKLLNPSGLSTIMVQLEPILQRTLVDNFSCLESSCPPNPEQSRALQMCARIGAHHPNISSGPLGSQNKVSNI